MIYVKSFLFGTFTAIAAAILWILAVFVVPIVVPFALSRVTGAGGVGAASIDSASILVAALVGFVAGFFWRMRRLPKQS